MAMKLPKIDCDGVRSNLYLYLGGELEAAPRGATAEHLSQCANCSEELAVASRARDVYLAAGQATLDDAADIDLWPGIRSRMFSEGLLGAGGAHPSGVHPGGEVARSDRADDTAAGRLPWMRSWPLAGAAAAAALLLFVPWLSQQFGGAAVGVPTSVDGALAESAPIDTRPVVGGPAAVDASGRFTPLANAADPVRSQDGGLLRPVLRGQESLTEREWKRLVEEAQNGTNTYPQDPSRYDVVNRRRLR